MLCNAQLGNSRLLIEVWKEASCGGSSKAPLFFQEIGRLSQRCHVESFIILSQPIIVLTTISSHYIFPQYQVLPGFFDRTSFCW